jgi:uncharacterized protein
MKKTLLPAIFALAAGSLFSLGLVVSGMTQPAKVVGFLNIGALTQGVSWTAQTGLWDPSLAFVMGGALAVTLLAFVLTPRAGKKPWAAQQFALPTRQDIDKKLIIGSVLFGIGWALAGYCPGPALASVFTGGIDAIAFVGAMLGGMFIAKKWLN